MQVGGPPTLTPHRPVSLVSPVGNGLATPPGHCEVTFKEKCSIPAQKMCAACWHGKAHLQRSDLKASSPEGRRKRRAGGIWDTRCGPHLASVHRGNRPIQ